MAETSMSGRLLEDGISTDLQADDIIIFFNKGTEWIGFIIERKGVRLAFTRHSESTINDNFLIGMATIENMVSLMTILTGFDFQKIDARHFRVINRS